MRVFRYLLETSMGFVFVSILLVSCMPCKDVLTEIKVVDTIKIPTIVMDTVVVVDILSDTIFLEKENLKVQIVQRRDTLFVRARCKGDTIIKNRTVTIRAKERVVYEKEMTIWGWVVMVVLGILVLLLAIRK